LACDAGVVCLDRGIPVSVLPAAVEKIRCPGYKACHLWSATQGASIVLRAGLPWRVQTTLLSHEVIETETDESFVNKIHGRPAEVCEPVQNNAYRIHGVSVSDYVFPRWFVAGSPKTWDALGDTVGAGYPTPGGEPPATFGTDAIRIG